MFVVRGSWFGTTNAKRRTMNGERRTPNDERQTSSFWCDLDPMPAQNDPHHGQPVLTLGPDPSAARLTMIMLHGRGASAEDILALAGELGTTDVAFVAPQAAGHTWYPYSFLAPLHDNEPGITSGLDVIAGLVDGLAARQIPHARIGLLGFSQGACLTLEFAARHPKRYAAVVGLSGGLIGPPGTPRDYPGSLAARRCSWVAATWTPTFRWRGFGKRRTCSAGWAPWWTNGSTRGWGTP
jgi:predicted esterase